MQDGMQDEVMSWLEKLEQYPQLETLAALLVLVSVAFLANWLVKHILVRGFYSLVNRIGGAQKNDFGVVKRLSNIVPALIISSSIGIIPGLSETVIAVIENVAVGFIILTIALALAGVLEIINMLYMRGKNAHLKPIKGYIQIVKIIIYIIATILIVAALIDRSPLILLSGLGAMAAVLMLIFQDTILSLVASVQISSNDMIRVGDWIEMPQLHADGDVIDIALHTVKVQNWDKTITTIPTKRFISDSFKNWRGMQESGGRRIKRSLFIDQHSVHFLTSEEIEHLKSFNLLKGYFDSKITEIDQWNQEHVEDKSGSSIDLRKMTNIGTFRAYILFYLRNHPGIHQTGLTLMVRQLSPTSEGLPLEIYCFTNTIAWVPYEGIQADIFDHLLAIAPEFSLRVYQAPSGHDMRGLGARI